MLPSSFLTFSAAATEPLGVELYVHALGHTLASYIASALFVYVYDATYTSHSLHQFSEIFSSLFGNFV